MRRAAEAPEKSIALIGLMGAGKTTIGRRLARRLGLPFIDTDAELEAAAGLGVAEVFERFGEAHFRGCERRAIARLVEGGRRVIATGGGAFIEAETRALILSRCTAIWLDCDVEILARRVGQRNRRPLLNGKDPVVLLGGLAEARGPIYAEAHLTIRSDRAPHERIVDAIVEALAAR